MNSINIQVDILGKLASLLMQSPKTDYESLSCRFEVSIEDETVETSFSYTRDGKIISSFIDDPDFEIMDWVFSLHEAMMQHTGGNWTAFTLTIGKDGQAKTKFEYPND
jgi:hypothetical protein